MTKAQANEIKSMITDALIQAEAKFLNKLKASNCANFVKTSNNDYCVCIDEGFNDKRYFILDPDCSYANDQEYYSQFVQYCNHLLVHLEVYKLLKSRDLTQFNPHVILETKQKQNIEQKLYHYLFSLYSIILNNTNI